ncbi:MAG: hypothetical protein L0H53_10650 [Candidatus Nitrosocosmicus sp.]|nr:hypothetical protein [Candidatus Nitrosocosmicus sp.]MDN5867949.1 hypothetical protein [Candidatus Nitrosocosmicus sp.]
MTVKAQNSALSQSGSGDDAEQKIRQIQSSNQDGQVVSGDSSILSGNNLLCQDQDNSDGIEGVEDSCNLEGINNPILPNEDNAVLESSSILRANNCNILIPPCPSPNGDIVITDLTTGEQVSLYSPSEDSSDPLSFFNRLPVGHEISIVTQYGDPRGDYYRPDLINVRNIHDVCATSTTGPGDNFATCNFIMGTEGAHIEVN